MIYVSKQPAFARTLRDRNRLEGMVPVNARPVLVTLRTEVKVWAHAAFKANANDWGHYACIFSLQSEHLRVSCTWSSGK